MVLCILVCWMKCSRLVIFSLWLRVVLLLLLVMVF